MSAAQSNAVIESQKLYDWCRRIKEHLERQRVIQVAALVDEEIKRAAKKCWWRRSKKLTREQAYARIGGNDSGIYVIGTPVWQAERYGWHVVDIVNRLMSACLVAPRVAVSTQDLEYLHGWSPKGCVEEIFQSEMALR